MDPSGAGCRWSGGVRGYWRQQGISRRNRAAGGDLYGVITGVGGGIIRDVLAREVPMILRTGSTPQPVLSAGSCMRQRFIPLMFRWKTPV